jgi:hypothetical protein
MDESKVKQGGVQANLILLSLDDLSALPGIEPGGLLQMRPVITGQ